MFFFDKLFRNHNKGAKTDSKEHRPKLAEFIVDHNRMIFKIVVVFAVFALLCIPFVEINYDLTSYLPDSAPSKLAIDEMEGNFGYPGTGRIMLKDVTLYEAKAYKERFLDVKGVDQIIWCDTSTEIYQASDFINYTDIDEYYKNNCAVMDVTFTQGDTSKVTHAAINEIEDIMGDRGYIVGPSPTNKFIKEQMASQMVLIMALAIAMIFVILLLTTTSWFEPVLFLSVIGVAVVINNGTNILLGKICFITNNISAVLQLATSMDYSIFLLHSFEQEMATGKDKKSAMKVGLGRTISTIMGSSMTTLVGFIVLIAMRFKLGFDLGIVMSKAIICSLLMVIFLMPSLLLMWSDIIDKTRHRPFLPTFDKFSKAVNRISPVILAVAIFIAVPCYVAQNMNRFQYGTDAVAAGNTTSIYRNTQEIDALFGKSNLLVVLFPESNNVDEKACAEEISDLSYVKKVMSLADMLPEGLPENMLPYSTTKLLHKNGFVRMLVYVKTNPESDLSFRATSEVGNIVNKYYPDSYYIAGNTPSTIDMEEILSTDYTRVSVLSYIGIFVVMSLTFHSVVLPLFAMIPILVATFVNMAFPYIVGDKMVFLGYLIVSCIQLGATIDYAILSANTYLELRQTKNKKESAIDMTKNALPSIITSGSILIVCGYTIYKSSSIPAISEVGHLVGRGAVCSVIFVVCLMPSLLKAADRFIVHSGQQKREYVRARIVLAAQQIRDSRRKRRQKLEDLLKK